MKIAVLILIVFGGLIFAAGSAALLVNLNSRYATDICDRAAADKEKFYQAKSFCRDTSSDCYKRMVAGLTDHWSCDAAKSYQWNSTAISATIAAFGLIAAIIGFFVKRRRAAVLT